MTREKYFVLMFSGLICTVFIPSLFIHLVLSRHRPFLGVLSAVVGYSIAGLVGPRAIRRVSRGNK